MSLDPKRGSNKKHNMSSGNTEKEAGSLVGKFPCVLLQADGSENCGSSDGMAVYFHEEDDSHSAFCWVCEESATTLNFETMEKVVSYHKPKNKEESKSLMSLPSLEEIRDDYIAVDNRERKLKAEYYELYGVKMELQDDGETIDKIFYPTRRDTKHVGYRPRSRFQKGSPAVLKDPSKEGILKCFEGSIGDTKKGIELFGQWLFSAGNHKRLFITEGEEDAITGYAMTNAKTKIEGGYAHVSVPSGANVAGLKGQLEYIKTFEEIYLVFDQDEAGQELINKALKFLPVGKVRIVKLPVKDLSELYTKCRGGCKQAVEIYWKAIWGAEKYSPVGIKSLSEGWGSYLNRGQDVLIPFPASFGDLNLKTYGGYALSEVTTIAAPSSVGKSSFVKEMIYEALISTNYNIGVASLEETLDEFIEGLLSIHMSKQLNEIPYDMRDRKSEWEAFQALLKLGTPDEEDEDSKDRVSRDRIHFLDHQGSCDGESLLDNIDFLISGLDCKIIILDPVTLALSGGDTDEDEFASDIVKATKRNNIAWINIHHVRKNSGGSKANSEGGEISEEDIKGSGAWFQTSSNNIILMRDKTHEHSIVRNTTTIKLSKCRRHGKNTGLAGFTYYNGETGRLEQGSNPKDIMEMLDSEGDTGAINGFGGVETDGW